MFILGLRDSESFIFGLRAPDVFILGLRASKAMKHLFYVWEPVRRVYFRFLSIIKSIRRVF